MNLVDFDAAIDAHIASNALSVPLVRDNKRTPKGETEWIRLTIIPGDGFLDESAGIQSVNGSAILHPFILSFQVFTEINRGTARNNELCQEILDNWQVRHLDTHLWLIAGNIIRIGEDAPNYQQNVQIPGRRQEFLIKPQ